MVRSYVNQGVQIGKETTPGTSVAANRKLMSLKLDPKPAIETKMHRPSGYKLPTAASVISEITEADFEGPIDYRSIIYPLSSLFGAATVTQPDTVNAPTVYQWKWSYTSKNIVTPVTYSVEVGDASRAVSFTHGVFESLDLSIEPKGDNTMNGSMVGRALVTGATMTSLPTEIEIAPVDGTHWDVYADATSADLGDTKLLALYEAGLSFSDLFAQEFTINSANSSFNSLYENEEPSFEWSMMVGADAVGEGFLTSARNSAKRFIRLAANGPIIEDDLRFGMTVDMCALVSEVDSYESNDGLYVLPLTFALAYDKTWTKALEITVINDIASL